MNAPSFAWTLQEKLCRGGVTTAVDLQSCCRLALDPGRLSRAMRSSPAAFLRSHKRDGGAEERLAEAAAKSLAQEGGERSFAALRQNVSETQ